MRYLTITRWRGVLAAVVCRRGRRLGGNLHARTQAARSQNRSDNSTTLYRATYPQSFFVQMRSEQRPTLRRWKTADRRPPSSGS